MPQTYTMFVFGTWLFIIRHTAFSLNHLNDVDGEDQKVSMTLLMKAEKKSKHINEW